MDVDTTSASAVARDSSDGVQVFNSWRKDEFPTMFLHAECVFSACRMYLQSLTL